MGEKQLTYLAIPYSHQSRAVRVYRFEVANQVAGELMAKGEIVFSPISHTHPIAEVHDLPKGWDYWHKFDYAYLQISKRVVVVMLDGWKESKGVQGEIQIAEQLGLPIEYYEIKQ